jgi:hypothetical protein
MTEPGNALACCFTLLNKFQENEVCSAFDIQDEGKVGR